MSMQALTPDEVRVALSAGWHLAGLCSVCGEPIIQIIERFDRYWTSTVDGEGLSYSPTLHDHSPIDHKENG